MPTTSTDPEALALVDDTLPRGGAPFDLRVSVPELVFVAPHAVDETDPVNVLITDLLTDGLTELDSESGEIGPGLADSWTVSDDRLTFTFELANVSFSNGSRIRAVDVIASLNRVAAMGIQSLSGPNLAVVEGYDAVATGEAESMSGLSAPNARTVEISLTEPYEPLPDLLAGVTFGVFPVEIDTTGPLPLSSSRSYRPTSMGVDGFRVDAVDEGARVTFIEVSIDPDGDKVASGEVDLAVGLDPDELPVGVMKTAIPRSANAFFAMNHAVPPFDDEAVRRAVVWAVDRVELRDSFFPDASLMDAFLPDAIPGGSDDACGNRCRLDVDAARAAIETESVGGIPFTVDFFVDDSDDNTEQRLAEAIVSSLRNVGLNATARAHSIDVYGERIAAGDLAMFRFGSVSASPAADAYLAAMFGTGGSDNVANSSIEDFDEIIDIARATPNASLRNALYGDAEALLFEKAVVLPVVQFQNQLYLANTIESASLEPDGSLDLASIVPADAAG